MYHGKNFITLGLRVYTRTFPVLVFVSVFPPCPLFSQLTHINIFYFISCAISPIHFTSCSLNTVFFLMSLHEGGEHSTAGLFTSLILSFTFGLLLGSSIPPRIPLGLLLLPLNPVIWPNLIICLSLYFYFHQSARLSIKSENLDN